MGGNLKLQVQGPATLPANTGEQSWEGKQHRILTGPLEHLNSILPKVNVN